jgi:hypothetical protein
VLWLVLVLVLDDSVPEPSGAAVVALVEVEVMVLAADEPLVSLPAEPAIASAPRAGAQDSAQTAAAAARARVIEERVTEPPPQPPSR